MNHERIVKPNRWSRCCVLVVAALLTGALPCEGEPAPVKKLDDARKVGKDKSGEEPEPVRLGGGIATDKTGPFRVYVPTKMGGALTVTATSGTIADLKDPARQPFTNGGQTSKHGWYTFKVAAPEGTYGIITNFVQKHKKSGTVWNSWWWPQDDNVDPNMYDITVTYSDPPGAEPGPLKKYDDYLDREADAVSAWKWEFDHTYATEGVGGHCDASSYAGLEEPRPSGDKTLTDPGGKSITFQEQDRLAMMVQRYWIPAATDDDLDEPGTGDPYCLFNKAGEAIHAAWFHNKLRERVSADKGLIVTANGWNPGIYKYKASFVAEGTDDPGVRRVTVEVHLTFKNWTKWSGIDVTCSTKYKLLYAKDGSLPSLKANEIDWISGKPDRAFYPKQGADLVNPNVNKAKLEGIYR